VRSLFLGLGEKEKGPKRCDRARPFEGISTKKKGGGKKNVWERKRGTVALDAALEAIGKKKGSPRYRKGKGRFRALRKGTDVAPKGEKIVEGVGTLRRKKKKNQMSVPNLGRKDVLEGS